MNLSAWSIRNPTILMLAVVIVSLWGLAALWDLARQEDPVITWRLANVVTRLPGAAPARVESLITDVIERYVRQVDEVEHIYSVSRSGVSLVQIELSDEVRVAAPAWQKVRQKLDEAFRELPPDVIGPTLDDEIMGTFTVLAAITGEGQSYRELKDHAQRLEDQWRYLPDAASTSLFGTQPEVIQVELDAARLAADALSFPQVAAALRQRNSRQPSGRLRIDESELQVEASGEFKSATEIADMVLHVIENGNNVRVRDVARVNRTTQWPPEPLARFQGKRAVVVGVRCRQAVRIDHFSSQALVVLDRFRDTLPAGVRADVFQDLGRFTRDRERELTQTLVWSTLGIFLSTAIFLNWRACLIIASAMPLTGLMVLTCFSLLRIPLDQMSVMAAIMAMGLLVDNAILVTEQIERRLDEGVDVMVAAAREPHALRIPLIVSTLTTVAAFVPIYLLPGGVGEFVRAIPIGMGIALLSSLLVAFTVTPWMATWLLGGNNGPRKPMIPGMDRAYRAMENRLMWLLERVLQRPGTSMAIATAIVTASFASGLTLRRDFFSPVQRNQFVIDVFTPQGSPVAYTSEVVQQIEALLVDKPGISSVASFIGSNAPLVFYNLQSQETYAAHFSQLIVTTDDWSHTMKLAVQTQQWLDEQIADAHCDVHVFEHGAPFVAPFEVRISGPAIETLDELGRRAGDILKQTQGVRNVRTNYGNSALKLIANVNEPLARAVGINQTMVADELRNRLDGLPAGSIQEDDERIEIVVRLPAFARETFTDLERIYFKPTAQAGLIPFSTFATLIPTWETASIYRRDSQRTLSVLAYPEFGQTAADVSRGFIPALNRLADQLPPGYRLELGGENEQRHEAETNLMRKGIYGVTIVVLLVMIEFRSIRLTFLIGCVVVFSAAGGVVALWLTGWPLNFMAMMGMAMYAGVAVNDATVLVDELERRRHAGESGTEMVLQGTRGRIRHVVITSATIGGYLPLAFSDSLLWPPMAIVMIGGLALSTLLTLVVVPAGYMLLRRP